MGFEYKNKPARIRIISRLLRREQVIKGSTPRQDRKRAPEGGQTLKQVTSSPCDLSGPLIFRKLLNFPSSIYLRHKLIGFHFRDVVGVVLNHLRVSVMIQ